MKKYTKKEINKTLENIKEVMEGEGDLVIVTDRIQVVKGNPMGVMANILKVIGTIRDTDITGKIVVSAAVEALKDEKMELTDKEKEDSVGELLEMLLDAVKNK